MGFWSKLFGKENTDEKEPNLVKIIVSKQQDEYKPIRNEEIKMAILTDYVDGENANFKPPHYLLSLCNGHINDLLKAAFQKGYIRLSTPQDGLKALHIPELKTILKENGLPVSGKKEILIERIISSLSEEKYSNRVPDLYIATEAGKNLIASNYVFIQFKYGIDPQFCEKIFEIKNRLGCGTTKEDYIKIYSDIYKSDIRIARRKKNWADLSTLYSNFSAILGDTNYPDHDLKKSLKYLLYSICINLSGMQNENFVHPKKIVMIYPNQIINFNNLTISIPENKVISEIDKAIEKSLSTLPFSYFSSEGMHTILLDLLNGELEDISIDKIKKYQSLWNTPDPNSTQYTYINF